MDAPIYSPEWWLHRLVRRLRDRALASEEYAAFHAGVQPLAFASEKFREVFGQRYSRLPANFMPLVVEAEAERLGIQGFRFGNRGAGDDSAWRIWQENQLDAESQIAHEIALVKGAAYTLVAPPMPGSRTPLITIEDPSEVILETAPGNRRIRLAALKVFTDDDGYAQAYLYLPDEVYRWRSKQKRTDESYTSLNAITWEPFSEEAFVTPNPLGVVPLIPLLNRPRRDGSGRSEIGPVMGNQLAINKLRFDALVASEYVAFPQRWATNIDIPIDEDTGRPLTPFKPGVDNTWATRLPDPDKFAEYGDKMPMPEFGQFPAADLSPYREMIREELGEMAAISRTPYYYLLGQGNSNPPASEQTKTSEAPLIRKVARQAVHFGEGWEETMRVALIAAGQQAKARTDGETIWADPETRNEAARTDSILKQYQAGLLPDEFALEELGYSQQQIERMRAMRAAERGEAPGS